MLNSLLLFVLNLLAILTPYIIVTLSLNLEYGFGGVPNFGKTLAVAGGAFIAGFLPGRVLAAIFGIGIGIDYATNNSLIIQQIDSILISNPLLSIGLLISIIGLVMLFGAFLGLIMAYPVAKLRSDYLGMVFLAAGQIILVIGNFYMPLVGGPFGVTLPDPYLWLSNYPILGLTPGEMRNVSAIFIMLIIALCVYIYVQRLTTSPLGRVLRAIRDDENSALALGKDVQRKRILVTITASSLAALAGTMYGLYGTYVVSSSFSRADWTFLPWVMLIIGGAANNKGVVAGTFIFVSVRQVINYFRDSLAPLLPFDP